MARKKPHEDHVNHEAWAIPYGDLLVLLLAFFVVMYAVSSVNEGKYRVLSDSLQQAFGGAPKSLRPVQFGSQQKGSEPDSRSSAVPLRAPQVPAASQQRIPEPIQTRMPAPRTPGADGAGARAERRVLEKMGQEIADALGELVDRKLVRVRNTEQALEVEIRADVLYPSGSAQLSAEAQPILDKVAEILGGFPNPIRIEGHTDSLPIRSAVFPSNWELSAARAASVVHLFVRRGLSPEHMSVAGFGEFRPAMSNDSVEGRNRNRRVIIVVLARSGETLPPASVEQPGPAPPPEMPHTALLPIAPLAGAPTVEMHR
jgi:chemotaxis protein MotB